MRPEPGAVRFFATIVELRAWFDANHASAKELWIGHYKRATGRPTVGVTDAIDEGLCFGWVDSVVCNLDEMSHAQRFTPRRQGSAWSPRNVAKAERLITQGRMRPAGLTALGRAAP